MTDKWPEHPDDRVDPAFEPLIEAGEGEAEGFDVAEGDLIEHAQHSDLAGTEPILDDVIELEEDVDFDVYADTDDVEKPD